MGPPIQRARIGLRLKGSHSIARPRHCNCRRGTVKIRAMREDDILEERQEGAWDDVFAVLERIPLVANVQKHAGALRDIVQRRRAPRILCVGSSEEDCKTFWHDLVGADCTPGLESWRRVDANGAPLIAMTSTANTVADASVGHAFKKLQPDIIITLDNPSLQSVQKLKEDVSPLGNDVAVAFYQRGSDAHVYFDGLEVLPTASWSATRTILVERLPIETRLFAVRAFAQGTQAQKNLGNQIIKACSTMSVTIGMSPIPFSDLLLLTPLQAFMVGTLAYSAGRAADKQAITEYLASLGVIGSAAISFRYGAQQLLKFVPGAGTVVSAGVAGAGTTALGKAATKYFYGRPPR